MISFWGQVGTPRITRSTARSRPATSRREFGGERVRTCSDAGLTASLRRRYFQYNECGRPFQTPISGRGRRRVIGWLGERPARRAGGTGAGAARGGEPL